MNKHITISVGIPVYNEEANIKKLLKSIIAQKEDGFIIEEIIVVSDGSKDNTIKRAKEVKNKKTKLIENRTRKGQSQCQNEIFNYAQSDIVILLEADTCPENDEFIYELVRPILENRSVGFVQGNAMPLAGKNIIEKTLSTQIEIFKKFNIDSLINIHLFCTGRGGRAFSKEVYKNLEFPVSVPEDVYALLWSLNKGIISVFQKNAVSLYRCPQTAKDYFKERKKIKAEKAAISEYFSGSNVQKIYKRSLSYRLRISLYFFIHHPLIFVYYFLLISFSHALLLKDIFYKTKFTDFWPGTPSTKSLHYDK